MRALAWRVCACVRPLYRNLEPITRKPLGGGSGDTSLGVTGVGGCQRAPVRPSGTAPRHCPPCAPAAAGAGACLPPGKEAWRRPGEGSSPEEGVMLYADLPEPLGRAVVGQLEANGALKLFVLGGDRDRLLRAHPALGDMAGQHLAKVLGFPWQEPQPCKKTPKIFFKSVPRRSVPSTMPSRVMGYTPHLWPKHFPQL